MPEILVIVVIALLLFGPKKLPGLGKSMGEAIRGFKKGLKEDSDDTAAPTVQPTARGPIVTPAPAANTEPPLISEPRNPTSTYTTVQTTIDPKIKNSSEES